MKKEHPLLKQVRVAAPCSMPWSEMEGDDRSRYCNQCNLQVFNLSDMSRDEAESLLRARTGRLCVRYYQRADGTVMTKNCPVGLAAVRHRLVLAAAACMALVSTGFAMVRRPQQEPAAPFQAAREKYFEAKDRCIELLGGEPTGTDISGAIAIPMSSPHPSLVSHSRYP